MTVKLTRRATILRRHRSLANFWLHLHNKPTVAEVVVAVVAVLVVVGSDAGVGAYAYAAAIVAGEVEADAVEVAADVLMAVGLDKCQFGHADDTAAAAAYGSFSFSARLFCRQPEHS